MNIKNIHLAYYSATFSTRRIVCEIASQFEKPVKEYDITSDVPKNNILRGFCIIPWIKMLNYHKKSMHSIELCFENIIFAKHNYCRYGICR